MNRRIAGALVGLSIVTGIGVGFAVQRSQEDAAAATPTRSTATAPATSTATPADPAPSPEAELGDVVPGAIEPIRVGMTVDEAVATGLVGLDDGQFCGIPVYRWTGDLSRGLDVLTSDGRINFVGMSKPLARTAEGITVGSDLADLRDAYGATLIGPEENDYGQATMFVSVGDDWIGFLFDEPVDQLLDASQISFVEVSTGRRPGLVRDGC